MLPANVDGEKMFSKNLSKLKYFKAAPFSNTYTIYFLKNRNNQNDNHKHESLKRFLMKSTWADQRNTNAETRGQ
jgi:hypothetical protein